MWIAANAIIMHQPLFFLSGAYGYSSYQGGAFTSGSVQPKGNLIGVVALLGPRVWPFLIPVAALLAARLVDGRAWRIESVSLVVLALSVIVGLIAPMAYLGSRMDFLRYYIYPLFAAAGWGLYEIAISTAAPMGDRAGPWGMGRGSARLPVGHGKSGARRAGVPRNSKRS